MLTSSLSLSPSLSLSLAFPLFLGHVRRRAEREREGTNLTHKRYTLLFPVPLYYVAWDASILESIDFHALSYYPDQSCIPSPRRPLRKVSAYSPHLWQYRLYSAREIFIGDFWAKGYGKISREHEKKRRAYIIILWKVAVFTSKNYIKESRFLKLYMQYYFTDVDISEYSGLSLWY